VYLTRAFVQQEQLDEIINELKRTLGADVVSLRYTLGEDWSGEPAIFFRVVLSDRASRRDQLRSAANQISDAIMQHIQPLEQWGVLPYFSFRSQAEQAVLQDKAWA